MNNLDQTITSVEFDDFLNDLDEGNSNTSSNSSPIHEIKEELEEDSNTKEPTNKSTQEPHSKPTELEIKQKLQKDTESMFLDSSQPNSTPQQQNSGVQSENNDTQVQEVEVSPVAQKVEEPVTEPSEVEALPVIDIQENSMVEEQDSTVIQKEEVEGSEISGNLAKNAPDEIPESTPSNDKIDNSNPNNNANNENTTTTHKQEDYVNTSQAQENDTTTPNNFNNPENLDESQIHEILQKVDSIHAILDSRDSNTDPKKALGLLQELKIICTWDEPLNDQMRNILKTIVVFEKNLNDQIKDFENSKVQEKTTAIEEILKTEDDTEVVEIVTLPKIGIEDELLEEQDDIIVGGNDQVTGGNLDQTIADSLNVTMQDSEMLDESNSTMIKTINTTINTSKISANFESFVTPSMAEEFGISNTLELQSQMKELFDWLQTVQSNRLDSYSHKVHLNLDQQQATPADLGQKNLLRSNESVSLLYKGGDEISVRNLQSNNKAIYTFKNSTTNIKVENVLLSSNIGEGYSVIILVLTAGSLLPLVVKEVSNQLQVKYFQFFIEQKFTFFRSKNVQLSLETIQIR